MPSLVPLLRQGHQSPNSVNPMGCRKQEGWQGREGRTEHSVSIIFSQGSRWEMTSEGLGEISAEAW